MSERGIAKALLVALMGLVGFVALLCLVPPISRDALVHHLAVPKIYLREGGMVELPGMEWAYYPMNLTLLYWGALALGSEILPKFIHFAFGLGTAALIFRYLKEKIDRTWGLFGALLFFSTPVVMKLSTTVYVDLGLSFFSFWATVTLFKAREDGFQNARGVALAGLLLGLGMGIKYNALPLLMLLTALLGIQVSRTVPRERGRDQKALGYAVLFVLMACLAYSPTGIRNTIWTKNPIYPLYNGAIQKIWKVGEAPKAVVKPEVAEAFSSKKRAKLYPIQVRRLIYNESALDALLLPVRIFFEGKDGDHRLFDGRFSPILFLSILSLILWRWAPRDWRFDLAGFHFLSWSFILIAISLTSVRVRYLMPIVPHLTVLAVLGIKCAVDLLKAQGPSAVRYGGTCVLAGFLGYGVWVSGSYGSYLYNYVKPLDYLSGKVDRDGYVGRYRFEHPTFLYANAHLKPSDRIFFVNLGKRGYYCDIPYIPDQWGNHFDQISGVAPAGSPLRTPEEMWRYLRGRGVTHMAAWMDLAWKRVVEGEGWSPEAKRNLQLFLGRYTREIYHANGVYLFELRK